MNKTAAAALILAATFAANAKQLTDAELAKIAEQTASNIVQRVNGNGKGNGTIGKGQLRKIASPENYALLTSTKGNGNSKGNGNAKRLALLEEIAAAAIEDEMETEAGRLKWHGPIVSEVIDMDALEATFNHADGYKFAVKFAKPNIVAQIEKANAKLPKPPMLRGIPAALAKARETRYAQKTNGVATVSVEVNATKGNRPKE